MSHNWRRIELVIGGKIKASQAGQSASEVGELIERFKRAARISKEEFEIYLYKKSRANDLIKYLDEPKQEKNSMISRKRRFDILELKELRDKGLAWVDIAKQLYTNERVVREYYRDYKHELYDQGANIKQLAK